MMVQATPPKNFADPAPIAVDAKLQPTPPRSAACLYHVPLAMVATPDLWPTILDACAGMGFGVVVISPPGDPGPKGNQLLPRDWDKPHPALPPATTIEGAVGDLAAACRTRGLALMVDLVVDRLATDGQLARKLELRATGPDARDPRIPPENRSGIPVSFADASGRQVVDRFVDLVRRLAKAGVGGLRCLHPERVPAAVWAEIGAAARKVAPGFRMLAWTPGVAAGALAALAGAEFDGAFSSLRWWDCRATWPVDDHERLSAFGPVLAFPEAPFGDRLAQELASDEIVERRIERALWIAATLGDGLLVPMGLEYGAREPVTPTAAIRETYAALRAAPRLELAPTIRAVNAFVAGEGAGPARGEMRILTGIGTGVTAVLRTGTGDVRRADAARLVLVNPALDRVGTLSVAALSPEAGRFLPFKDVVGSGATLDAESVMRLGPGDVQVLDGVAGRTIVAPVASLRYTPGTAIVAPRLAIEAVTPSVDGGRYAVKRIVGEVVRVEADVFGEGHDLIAVALKWRAADEDAWRERRMVPLGNDRWTADLPLDRLGRYHFTIETWRDEFAIFHHELEAKHDAGLAVPLELEEGRRLLVKTLVAARGDAAARLKPIAAQLDKADDATRLAILMAPDTAEAMAAADPRPFLLTLPPIPIDAERTAAGFASWYSIFPRSTSGDANRHGTFDDVIRRLPAVRAMGFDVLYFTPIHPIGRTNRKGRNNSLTAGPDDPGSPYAIGSVEGGHSAIHSELGTFEDLRRLVTAAAEHGLELAFDIAIQASPDHPWLKDHPDWFNWRPDGTIRYAENPPKKYEDIVNVDFYQAGAMPSLWIELRDMILLWVEQGVKLFRVDNPHTKPFPFWEWLIEDVRREHPDVVFLSEAFTKPKVMYRLAKVGFSQSYTYFTWRNTKYELSEYLTEITTQAPKDFFRPHFFVNTHDINPDFLQNAPRSAFLIRAALATMLSGLWGMYNGFELCEGRPDQKKKEYADSEKYQLFVWDWDRPGNIIGEISRLNRIRRDNPALHSHLGITFRLAYNDNVLLFEKATPTRDNVLLIAVSLDPYSAQEADIEVPLWEWGLNDGGTIAVEDLMRGSRFSWTGKIQRIRLDPGELPFSIWRLSR